MGRGTVKTAATAPVLPSVTVTSPTCSRGVVWSVQAPSSSSTATAFEPPSAAADQSRRLRRTASAPLATSSASPAGSGTTATKAS